MILIGQYDSPFVRRVGIALTLYGLPFEHRPWSTFGEADLLRPINPLTRVPTLIADGVALTDSHVILAEIDARLPPERVLMPRDPHTALAARRIIGLATGLADLAVSLFYELLLHESASEALAGRRRRQILDTVAAIETDAASRPYAALFESRIGHADIALACALRFLREAHPRLVLQDTAPGLAARCEALEAQAPFRAVSQPFIPPA